MGANLRIPRWEEPYAHSTTPRVQRMRLTSGLCMWDLFIAMCRAQKIVLASMRGMRVTLIFILRWA